MLDPLSTPSCNDVSQLVLIEHERTGIVLSKRKNASGTVAGDTADPRLDIVENPSQALIRDVLNVQCRRHIDFHNHGSLVGIDDQIHAEVLDRGRHGVGRRHRQIMLSEAGLDERLVVCPGVTWTPWRGLPSTLGYPFISRSNADVLSERMHDMPET